MTPHGVVLLLHELGPPDFQTVEIKSRTWSDTKETVGTPIFASMSNELAQTRQYDETQNYFVYGTSDDRPHLSKIKW